MGASLVYLEKPNKEIKFDLGENQDIKFVAAGMQGWRINMVSHINCSSCFGMHEDMNPIRIFTSKWLHSNYRKIHTSLSWSLLRTKLSSECLTAMAAER